MIYIITFFPKQAFEQFVKLSTDENMIKRMTNIPAFIASLPLNKPEEAVKEARRAVEKLGARGVQLFTNVLGIPLDDPRFKPIFQLMAEYDLPIFFHPVRPATISDYPKVEDASFRGNDSVF